MRWRFLYFLKGCISYLCRGKVVAARDTHTHTEKRERERETRDAWVWRQPRFSAKATYRLLCGQLPPRGPSHYLEVQVGLEATHYAEDSYIRMASLTAVAHDPGRAPAHASGHLCELPSL